MLSHQYNLYLQLPRTSSSSSSTTSNDCDNPSGAYLVILLHHFQRLRLPSGVHAALQRPIPLDPEILAVLAAQGQRIIRGHGRERQTRLGIDGLGTGGRLREIVGGPFGSGVEVQGLRRTIHDDLQGRSASAKTGFAMNSSRDGDRNSPKLDPWKNLGVGGTC